MSFVEPAWPPFRRVERTIRVDRLYRATARRGPTAGPRRDDAAERPAGSERVARLEGRIAGTVLEVHDQLVVTRPVDRCGERDCAKDIRVTQHLLECGGPDAACRSEPSPGLDPTDLRSD